METYKIHVICTNCRYKSISKENMIEIPKGITVEHYLLSESCHNCRCKSLIMQADNDKTVYATGGGGSKEVIFDSYYKV